MTYSLTSRLQLKKAVAGTNQPFETAVFNENWDKIDADSVTTNSRLSTVESANNTTAGSIAILSGRMTSAEDVNTTQNSRLTTLEGSTTSLTTQVTSGTVNNASKVGGRTLFVQSGTPSGAVTGDIWVQV